MNALFALVDVFADSVAIWCVAVETNVQTFAAKGSLFVDALFGYSARVASVRTFVNVETFSLDILKASVAFFEAMIAALRVDAVFVFAAMLKGIRIVAFVDVFAVVVTNLAISRKTHAFRVPVQLWLAVGMARSSALAALSGEFHRLTRRSTRWFEIRYGFPK